MFLFCFFAITFCGEIKYNSFRVLFDKIASVYFICKKILYFSIGNGQPREPALCQLYRRTFVPCVKEALIQGLLELVVNMHRSQRPADRGVIVPSHTTSSSSSSACQHPRVRHLGDRETYRIPPWTPTRTICISDVYSSSTA